LSDVTKRIEAPPPAADLAPRGARTGLLARTCGFLLSTAFVVTSLHLARERSPGEAVDGMVSSLWFTLTFLAGGVATCLATGSRGGDDRGHGLRDGLAGGAAGVVTWTAVALFWALPVWGALRHARDWAFAINSTGMALAGAVVVLPAARGRRSS